MKNYQKIKINSHSPFQKLKKVLVGASWDTNYFDFIKDKNLKSPLEQILFETNEDLQNLLKIFKRLDIDFYQPNPFTNETKNMALDNPVALQSPPLQPRGEFLTLGNKCYQISTLPVWNDVRNIIDSECYENQFDSCWKANDSVKIDGNYLSGANCIKLGDRIILPPDLDSRCKQIYIKKLQMQGYKTISTQCNGHTDGVLSVLKPGALISLNDIVDYEKNFPKWDVLYLPDQSWSKISPFLKIKEKVGGRWWVPGHEENKNLIEFVNVWLRDWVGFCEETVFDVNILSLSEDIAIVNNYNKEVFNYFKKHKIEPIIWKQRHRYFWDGGVHCLTLDLEREGNRENYF